MSESELVRYADGREKFVLHRGEGFVHVRLPEGTRVIYPPKPLPPVRDVDKAIDHALAHPLGSDPLKARLRPGMKVTIAFDDISLPLPPMQAPDLRRRIIERLLTVLAEAGIDDIHLIAALALHRRMTPAELRAVLGPRIFDAYHPDRLYNHDAEDPENVVFLGETEKGEVVELSRRAVESDLLIYVNINLVSMDGGNKAIPIGLGTYRSIRHHHNVHTMHHCESYMDPPRSELHHSCDRMGRIVDEHCSVFHVETTLNNATFPSFLGFLEKQEREYTAFDRCNFQANRAALDALPFDVKNRIFHAMRAPYGLTSIQAGETNAVHRQTLENVYRQQLVPVEGQSDVMVVGLPYLGPYNVNSIMNPILVWCLGLGYMFNLYRNKPLVRRGGVMILIHPLYKRFNTVHHPSYVDFYEEVLAETREPAEIERRFEKSYAENPRYIDLYRHSHAYHGVHPFYMWYWGAYAHSYLGRVICVAPESDEAARRLGWDAAPTLDAALEMARDTVGGSPSVSVYHCPPLFLCDVS
jgi:lactate racemase